MPSRRRRIWLALNTGFAIVGIFLLTATLVMCGAGVVR